jgi:hypothetical protein
MVTSREHRRRSRAANQLREDHHGRDQVLHSEFTGVVVPFDSPAVAFGPQAFGRITSLGVRPTEATGPEIAEEIPACSRARQGGLCSQLHFDLA